MIRPLQLLIYVILSLLFSILGHRGLGKRTLEKCNTCMAFFTELKQRGYISRDNILYLNKILYILDREDLTKRTVEYCLEEGDVICYYSADEQPCNISFHFNALSFLI